MDYTISKSQNVWKPLRYLLAPGGMLVRFRFDIFDDFEFEILDDEKRQEIGLDKSPEWYKGYQPNTSVEWMPQAKRFNAFRAERHPDDVGFYF